MRDAAINLQQGYPTCKLKVERRATSRTASSFATLKSMRRPKVLLTLLLFGAAAFSQGQAPTAGTKPDNTEVNKRDRNSGEATADQQKMNAADEELTKKIRQSIMADKSLSTHAHNIKIISQNGAVTLKGPVKSDSEKQAVVAKAAAVAGTDRVTDQLSVAQ
jgi:hyperosmotically inducible protein